MEIKDIISKVKESEQFKSLSDDYYLAHIFKMLDDPNMNSWQVGYYSEKEESMTTFMVENDEITVAPPSEVFKKPESKLHGLEMDGVQFDWEQALGTSNSVMKEKYANQPPIKTFFILQNIEGEIVYNITYLTKTFNTINFKIAAESGEIKKEEVQSLMDMAKFEKGEGGND